MPMRHSRALKASGGPDVHAPFTEAGLTRRGMPAVCLAISALLFSLLIGSAQAADAPQRSSCLSRAEQRAAVASNHAISLAQAIKFLREHRRYSEVVRARLCQQDQKLVYVLTLLGRSGKVITATIDAVNGEFRVGRSAEN
jgi:hypothetical protein